MGVARDHITTVIYEVLAFASTAITSGTRGSGTNTFLQFQQPVWLNEPQRLNELFRGGDTADLQRGP